MLGNIWQYPAHVWDEEELQWVKTEAKSDNNIYNNDSLKVLSYNVWFDQLFLQERMAAVGQIISDIDPDVIALQEVTAQILHHLLAQPWTHSYYVSDPNGRELERYGVMLMSKRPFVELGLRAFPGSRLGRKALLGRIMVGSMPVVIGTFHLESYPQDAPERKSQLQMLKDLTSAAERVVLCGDTNFAYPDEAKTLGTRFQDVWERLYSDCKNPSIGYTMDPSVNPQGCTIH